MQEKMLLKYSTKQRPCEIQCHRQRTPASSLSWDQLDLAAGFSEGDSGRTPGRKGGQSVSHSRAHEQKLAHWRNSLLGSDFHTKVNSKATWFFLILCLFSFFILLHSLHWPSILQGITPTQKGGPASHVQEQSTLFIPLWNASDFTLQLPPNSTCLTSNSPLWVVLSFSLSFSLAPT